MSDEPKVPYKPDSMGIIRKTNLKTGKEGVVTVVYNLPLPLTQPLFEVLNKATPEDRELLIKLLSSLFNKSIRLLIGFTQASQKALEETYAEAFKKLHGE